MFYINIFLELILECLYFFYFFLQIKNYYAKNRGKNLNNSKNVQTKIYFLLLLLLFTNQNIRLDLQKDIEMNFLDDVLILLYHSGIYIILCIFFQML